MELLNLFKRHLATSNTTSSKSTVKNYVSDIRHFLGWFEQLRHREVTIEEVTPDVIKLYEKSLGGRIINGSIEPGSQLSVASMKRHLSSLRKLFTFLENEKLNISNPFREITPETAETPTDYWHLQSFKDYLIQTKASKLTIKNYLSDIQSFAKWYEEAILPTVDKPLTSTGGFYLITQSVLSDYRERLLQIQKAAPRTINRKLSSLRRYLVFAAKKGFINSQEMTLDPVAIYEEKITQKEAPQLSLNEISVKEKEGPAYSKFPPLRLTQKLFIFPYLSVEEKAANIIAGIITGTPVSGVYDIPRKVKQQLADKTLLRSQSQTVSSILNVNNVSKEFYAPQKVSLLGMPLHKKALHHVRHSRPGWYKKYHNYQFVHYAHFALLVIFASGVGVALYQNLIAKRESSFAAPTAPPRVLSFQGRLTDNLDNPITTPTNIRFAIYNDSTASGSALLWQEVIGTIAPDQDGIFSVILGEGTTIPSTVFTDNANIYLGVTIFSTAELAPRQRIASVGYATNAEFLQGLPPSTQAGITSFSNVILALDSSGNLILSDVAPTDHTFQVNNGTFNLSGQNLYLTTNTGSDGSVILDPNGFGKIDVRKGLVNSTDNGSILPGGVEVHDRFGVLATESAVAAFIVNNDAGGDIFTASSSGTTRFSIASDGSLTAPFYNGQNAVLYGMESTGLIAQLTTPTSGLCLQSGSSTPTWATCGGANYWNLTGGSIKPINDTVDLLVGGQTTASAKFRFINNLTGTPVASVSANSGNNATFLAGDGTLGTTNRQTLTIGNSSAYNTTGNILINPNGTGRIGIGTTNPLLGFDLRGNSGTQAAASISAQTSAATLIVDNRGVGDLFAASASGVPNFIVRNNGDIVVGQNGEGKITAAVLDPYLVQNQKTTGIQSLSYQTMGASGADHIFLNQSTELGRLTMAGQLQLPITGATGGILIGGDTHIYRGNTNRLDLSTGDSFNIVNGSLQMGGVTVIDASRNGTFNTLTVSGGCTGCISSNITPFQALNGAIAPLNSTLDFLIGGQSTSSAKFAVLNIINGTPTASVSAGTSGATYINAGGTLQTTANQTLSLGGSTTGNILLNPDGNNYVGIGTSEPQAALDVTAPSFISAVVEKIRFGNNSAIGILGYDGSQNNEIRIGAKSNHGLELITNDTVKALITSGGNFGIGTTDPSALLDVAGTASISGSLKLYGTPNIQSTANQTLTLGGDTTGNILLNSDGNGFVGIGHSNPTVSFDVSGNVNIRSASDATDYLSITNGASTTTLTRNTNGGTLGGITLDSSGTLTAEGLTVNTSAITFGTFTTNGGLLYTNGSGLLGQTDPGSLGECLISAGGGSPTWGSCVGSGGTNWNIANGVITPKLTSTLDFLLGSNSTSSAKFAVLNINNGTPTASVSSTLTGNGIAIGGDGRIQSVRNNTLFLGGNTTGNIVLSPLNGSGRVGIGTDSPRASLDVAGTASISGSLTFRTGTADIQTSESRTLTIGGDTTGWVTLAPNNSAATGRVNVTGRLAVATGGTDPTLDTSFEGLQSLGSGDLSITARGDVRFNIDTNTNGTNLFRFLTGTSTQVATIDESGNLSLAANSAVDTLTNGTLGIGTVNATTITIGRSGQGITLPGFTTNGGLFYANGSGVLAQTSAGASNQCLLGGATPTWGACTNSANSPFFESNGTILQHHTGLDFVLGGLATSSAKFAVLNLNGTGPATATVSGNFIVMPHNGAGGFVGLGTSTPSAKLAFAKSNNVEGGIKFGDDANLFRSGTSTLTTLNNFFVGATSSNISSSGLATINSQIDNTVEPYEVQADMGNDGFFRIVYTDDNSGDLKFVQCTNADCSTNSVTTIDAGKWSWSEAMEIGPDGFARIVYVHGNNGDMVFVQCTNTSCSTNNTQTLDVDDWFYDIDIAMGADGFARIVYTNDSTGELSFLQCTNASCSTNNITSLNPYADDATVQIAGDGFGRIAYQDRDISEIIYVQCTNASCSTNNTSSIGSNADDSSMVLGSDGFGRIAYIDDQNNGSLRFVQCTNASCSSYNSGTIDSSSFYYEPSLILDNNGFPIIVYQDDNTGDSKTARCTDAMCDDDIEYSYLPDLNDYALLEAGIDAFFIIYGNNGLAFVTAMIDANFSPDGNDLYIAGDLGVKSNIFTDGSILVGGTGSFLSSVSIAGSLSVGGSGVFEHIGTDSLYSNYSEIEELNIRNALYLDGDFGAVGQCLKSSADMGAPVWEDCTAGIAPSPFQVLSGAIVPFNSTLDFMIGGQATASAKFSITDIAKSSNAILNLEGSAYVRDLIAEDITLSGLSTSIITGYAGFDGYTGFTGGIGTGGNGKDSVTGAQRIDSIGNLKNIASIQAGETLLTSGGTFGTASNYAVSLDIDMIAVNDLNGDNFTDITVSSYNDDTIGVFINNGDGTFATVVEYGTGSEPLGIVSNDFNGDGYADIAVVNVADDDISVFINNGDGTFATKVDYSVGNAPVFLASGDFNGDGKIDIAVSNNSGSSVTILNNEGDGVFRHTTTLTAGVAPRGITVGDLNGDSKADIAVVNVADDDISVFINNGDGTFATKVDYSTIDNGDQISTGDLNNDGRPDLVVTGFDDEISIFINNGDGTFATSAGYQNGSVWTHSAAIGDVNGDGILDIVVSNLASNTISVLINQGDGISYSQTDYTGILAARDLKLADLNGDGKVDIAVASNQFGSPSLAILLNQARPILYAQASTGFLGIGTTSPTSMLHVTRPLTHGVTGKALAIFDQIENQDILTASSSGTTRFAITNAGGFRLGTSEGSSGQCLQSGGAGSAVTWGSCGGNQTPWTSDIDADGFDLGDLSNLGFRETTGAPAGTVVGLFRDNSGDLNINALTSKSINLQVNGTDEYNFSSTTLAMNGNNITGIGTTLSAAAGLSISTTTTGILSLDSGTTGAVDIGTGANAKTITIGNTTGATALNLNTGTGGINLGDNANTKTIDIGGVTNSGTDTINIATNGTAADTIAIGNSNASTTLALTGGDDWSINSSGTITSASTTGISLTGSGAGITFSGSGNHDITTSTGNLTLGAAGNLVFNSTGGTIDFDDSILDFSTQATDFELIDNSATALTLSQSTNNYLVFDTGNNSESLTIGNSLSNMSLIFDRGASGTITFSDYTNAGGIFYANGVGNFLQTAAGSATDCLKGGSTPSWGSCGSSQGSNWTISSANGTIRPNNNTLDLLIGGTTTASAKFAVLNVAGSGPATATVSGNLIVMPHNGAGGRIGINKNSDVTYDIDIKAKDSRSLRITGPYDPYFVITNNFNTGNSDLTLRTYGAADLQSWVKIDPYNGETSLNTCAGGNGLKLLLTDDELAFQNITSTCSGITAPGNFSIRNTGQLSLGTNAVNMPGFVNINAGNAGGAAAFILNQTGSAPGNDIFTASSSGTTRFTINNSGFVGIGTGTPLDDLHVQANDASIYLSNAGESISSKWFLSPGNNNFIPGTLTGDSGIDFHGVTGGFVIGSSSGVKFKVANDGNVGIGTYLSPTGVTPRAQLHVFTNSLHQPAASISARQTSAPSLLLTKDTTGDILVASASGLRKFWVNTDGDIFHVGDLNSVLGDFAEYFKKADVNENFEAGQLVCASGIGVTKCTPSTPNIIGAVSDNAMIKGGGFHENDPEYVLVGLVGQLGIRVTGDVKKGDALTFSSIPGVAVKATKESEVIGFALKDKSAGNPRVETVIQPKYYNPHLDLQDGQTVDALALVFNNGIFSLIKPGGSDIFRVDAFSKAVIANLRAGAIQAQSLTSQTVNATTAFVGTLSGNTLSFAQGSFQALTATVSNLGNATASTLAIATDSVTISGQNIRDFIIETVQNAGFTNQPVSPLATNEVKTNVVSPLSDEAEVELRLNNDNIEITNSQTGRRAAWFDNNGNASISGELVAQGIAAIDATFSGTLASNTLTTNEASVGGTLRADTIIANNIEGLENKISSIAGNLIATTQSTNINTQNITAQFGIFEHGITAMGPITAPILTATDQLAVGGNFTISDNAINTIGADLEIQSFRQGNIAFQGGLIKMDTDGNMEIAGNLNVMGEIDAVFGVFSGTLTTKALATSLISPLPGDDLTIQLTDDIASNSSKLRIANAQDQEVLSINNKGDIISSGAATLAKLNFNLVGQAQATSLSEAVATGSAGFATLRAGQPEITIINPHITSKSLIYITPFGDTGNKVLYLQRQTPATEVEDGSFTVGISGQTSQQNIQFNWLIVN